MDSSVALGPVPSSAPASSKRSRSLRSRVRRAAFRTSPLAILLAGMFLACAGLTQLAELVSGRAQPAFAACVLVVVVAGCSMMLGLLLVQRGTRRAPAMVIACGTVALLCSAAALVLRFAA